MLVRAAAGLAAAYALGSIPTGVVVCKPLGVDPRRVGSGRTGGTNVLRTAGWPAAIVTVAGDVVKGYAAVALARALVPAPATDLASAAAALLAVAGHNYSIFLGFKGGAGSAPNLGAMLAFSAPLALASSAAGIVVLAIGRMASVASLTVCLIAAAGLAWGVATGNRPADHLLYGFGQVVLVAWALRPNIARLRAGTERRITFRRDDSAD